MVALGTTGSTTSTTTTVLVHKTDPQILLHLEQGLYPLARFNFKYFKFVNRENKLEQGSPIYLLWEFISTTVLSSCSLLE